MFTDVMMSLIFACHCTVLLFDTPVITNNPCSENGESSYFLFVKHELFFIFETNFILIRQKVSKNATVKIFLH